MLMGTLLIFALGQKKKLILCLRLATAKTSILTKDWVVLFMFVSVQCEENGGR
jgi:hypothetical protein